MGRGACITANDWLMVVAADAAAAALAGVRDALALEPITALVECGGRGRSSARGGGGATRRLRQFVSESAVASRRDDDGSIAKRDEEVWKEETARVQQSKRLD
jgi:hypothetical protein